MTVNKRTIDNMLTVVDTQSEKINELIVGQ